MSVHFSDNNTGWAVGGDFFGRSGSIIATTDGGQTWKAQVSPSISKLNSVYFSDTSRGWAMGSKGTIIETSDGGNHWRTQASPTQSPILSAGFSDDVQGWAVGADGTIIATSDGGKHWLTQTSTSRFGLNGVYFSDASHGWAVAGDGAILATSDSGKSWVTQASPSRENLKSVHFINSIQGWAVGGLGTIISTRDGGKTWAAQSDRRDESLSDVFFSDLRSGWAIGSGGTSYVTNDGGRTWAKQLIQNDEWLYSVHFNDASYGWAVGDFGTIVATNDGGKTWSTQVSSSTDSLNSVHFNDPKNGWAVGGNLFARSSTIIATSNGGSVWQKQISPSNAELHGVKFRDANHGWAVGDNGTIVATSDAGKTWLIQNSGTEFSLTGIAKKGTSSELCAVGFGTILNSANGGKTWHSIKYKRFPAPWAWLTWFLSGLAGWRAWRRAYTAPPLEKERNIEDKGASDAPVEKGDQDRLNFEPVAKALAKFLQNQSTTAPLVLAVTGKWGTGKSSLMGLLANELRSKFRVRSVWFNAWHHQNEENLLAALLENIRQQAVPPLHTLHGMKFRVLLACARYRKRWMSSSIWLAFFVAAIGYIWVAPNAGWAQFVAWVKMLTKDGSDLDNVGALSGASGVALIAVAVKVFLSLRAFGVNPAALMATTANQFKLRDASAQAGFRFQFQREFEEVTTSLERIDKRMLIFIDDLDRCQPDKVIQILEAVNFLTSSGKCYIVLGMDRDYVESAVGLSFEKIAQEIAEHDAGSSQGNGKQQRQEFARRYMKKLLNLEIPIPSLDPALAETLFDESRTTQNIDANVVEKITWHKQLFSWLTAQKRWAPLVGALLVAGVAWFGGSTLGGLVPAVSEEKKDEKTNAKPGMPIQFEIENRPDGKMLIIPKVAGELKEPQTAPPPDKPKDESAVTKADAKNLPERNSGPAVFEAGQTTTVPWAIPIPLLIASALLLGYILWRSQDAVVRDSEAFTRSLNIWKRLVIAKSANPREIKRFQNRVRYFAMRLRDDRERKAVSPETQQTEAMLVALAALHHAEPRLLTLAKQPGDLNLDQYGAVTSNEMPFISTFSDNDKKEFNTLWNLMRACLKEHQSAKLEWPPTSELIERFKRWSDGIVT
jgi:photosystem II stability/assembly factor-like uncharacterized protein